MTALTEFHQALSALLDRGVRPPCSFTTETDNPWLSDSETDQMSAALKCRGCPLIAACFEMADETKTSFGVFGGHLFTKPPKQRARAMSDASATNRKAST